jgi:putative tryptophan/tyrosine transport system substrate-binding protein
MQFDQVRRREFITILGGAAAMWPLVARAQQAGKLPLIAILGDDATVWKPWTESFVDRLRELGWIEGRNVGIEYRWSEGRAELRSSLGGLGAGVRSTHETHRTGYR